MADAHDEIQAFFDGWQIYQTVIAEDYMNHRAIHAAVRGLLEAAEGPHGAVIQLGPYQGKGRHPWQAIERVNDCGVDILEMDRGDILRKVLRIRSGAHRGKLEHA